MTQPFIRGHTTEIKIKGHHMTLNNVKNSYRIVSYETSPPETSFTRKRQPNSYNKMYFKNNYDKDEPTKILKLHDPHLGLTKIIW